MRRDYAKAQNLSEAHIDRHSRSARDGDARYYLGLSYLQQGETDLAREIFRELVRTGSDGSLKDKAYLGLLDTFLHDGRYEQADRSLREVLSARPNSDYLSLFYLKGAQANLKMARWHTAEDLLQKIVQRYPHSPEAHRAKQLLREEQYFAVQVGAFLSRARAENLVGELKDRGEYAYIVETTDSQGRTFYRVRAGKLGLLSEAEDLKERLSRLGYPTRIYP